MKHLLIAISLIVATASCSAQEAAPTPAPVVIKAPEVMPTEKGETTVHCVYKYDSRYNIDFLKKDKVDYRHPMFPEMLSYRIIDTQGRHWSVNQYDWPNYTCTETTLPKESK